MRMEDIRQNSKYRDLMCTARELFWKHGFKRVTIEEICRKASVSKMTFYRFFPNKLEIARAVFDEVVDESLVRFREIASEKSAPAEKMKRMLQLKFEGTSNISPEFLQDFYNNPELGLKDYIEAKSKAVWIETLEVYRKGKQEGWIRSDLNVEFMFTYLQMTTHLLSDKKLIGMFNTPQEMIMEVTNLFIYGISPKHVL